MAHNDREYELVLLGASGYTGKLTAEYIAQHLPTDLKWAVAGRNAKKLQAVVEEIAQLNPDRAAPAIEVCELKKEELGELARKTRLVITTVGPFMFYGEQVLEACAGNGTHYLDCTGEIPWVYEMIEKYHETARKNGAIIIPQAGVDSVPSDLLTFVLTTTMRRTHNAPTSNAIVSLAIANTGVSGGTLLTAISLFSKYSLRKLAMSMKPYALSPVPAANPSPSPSSSWFYRAFGLLKVDELGGLQTDGVMASVNTSIVHRSWGLYESIVAKDSSKSSLSYGSRFRYTEYMRAKGFVHGAVWHYMFLFTGVLLAFPLTRWILTPLLKLVLPGAGSGPSKEEMKNNILSWRGIGIAETESSKKVAGEFTVKKGGYEATALTLAEAAMVILRGDVSDTEAGKLGGGVLTPATLGEQYVKRLQKAGVKLEAERL
ncbi:hypothetical protein GQ43DRAFT_440262 [Delitschia confertaspora ATCC 74209]|uniref:Saccharopine dehydrogenase NADP binding domain-containing protein n=1 Tax=Delitschia confertaspora ATCC 74209 TaxID=1513339 RepID=A0A9P4JR92_9PLEO|nr:hypothetical protein GQ43DRAFT_440262 [Delitschia confertaspora ATCC 74209]